jgi:hypothetical protein
MTRGSSHRRSFLVRWDHDYETSPRPITRSSLMMRLSLRLRAAAGEAVGSLGSRVAANATHPACSKEVGSD